MIVLYFIILLIASYTIWTLKGSQFREGILFVALIFAVLTFFQVLKEDSDLYVAFYHLNQIRQQGWSYFSDTDLVSNYYFTGRDALKVYFYLLSFLPYNNFYSAISIFIIFYLPMRATLIAGKYYGLSNVSIKYLLILLIWMIDFMDGSNGVRNMLSFSIFSYAFVFEMYRENKKGKHIIAWCLYIVSAFIHSSAWVLVILRLCLFIKNKKIQIALGAILLCWSLGLQYIPFLNIGDSENAVVGSMSHHVEAYTTLENSSSSNFNEETFNNQSSYILMRYFRIAHVLLIGSIIFKAWRTQRKLSETFSYILLLGCFCIGSTVSSLATNILSRFSFEMIFLTPIFYANYSQLPIKHTYINVLGKRFEKFAFGLFVIALLFNYYMFRYHYHYMFFDFLLYD